MRSGIDFIGTYRVRPDRTDDFEDWMFWVVVPVLETMPELAAHWELLRVDEPEDDGCIVYVALFRGGSMSEWDLAAVIEQQRGRDRAEDELAMLTEMLCDERPFSDWSVRSVDLGSSQVAAPNQSRRRRRL
jgi:hypothetical protein